MGAGGSRFVRLKEEEEGEGRTHVLGGGNPSRGLQADGRRNETKKKLDSNDSIDVPIWPLNEGIDGKKNPLPRSRAVRRKQENGAKNGSGSFHEETRKDKRKLFHGAIAAIRPVQRE